MPNSLESQSRPALEIPETCSRVEITRLPGEMGDDFIYNMIASLSHYLNAQVELTEEDDPRDDILMSIAPRSIGFDIKITTPGALSENAQKLLNGLYSNYPGCEILFY
jgi:hypothetical protein